MSDSTAIHSDKTPVARPTLEDPKVWARWPAKVGTPRSGESFSHTLNSVDPESEEKGLDAFRLPPFNTRPRHSELLV